jgi:FHS family L-fucose permease-like MFS transporter
LEEAQKSLIRTTDLLVIRNPYVILGLVVLGILVLLAIAKMPQGKAEGGIPPLKITFQSLFTNSKYRNGVLAQVFYVGAQIMCWTYIYQYAEAIGISSEIAANYQFAAFILFLVGRAIGTYMLRFFDSGRLLMIFALLAGLFTILTIIIQGTFGLYCLVMISFFMSLMFPTIYGIALYGLDEEASKIGAAGLVMAIVGGALMPKLQGMIIDLGGNAVDDIKIAGTSEINFSFILPLLCFLFIAWYGRTVHQRSNILKPI